MKSFFWIVLLSILFVGCGENKPTESKKTSDKNIVSALKQKLEITNERVILLPEAQEVTSEWLAYITAQSEIENFRNYTLNDVIANATPITEIMQSLMETLPPTLQSNAVEARLGVLVTKAKILQQLAGKRTLDPDQIAKTAQEIPTEFNNFKIQLNELFLKTLEQFEEELDSIDNDEPIQKAKPELKNRPNKRLPPKLQRNRNSK